MAKLSFSVAMCTYNGARYVKAQLYSIAAQDRLPSELVVRDDGSDDGTVSLVREFAARAPFPVSIEVNQQRLGPGKNFEKAIGSCTADIIALADQDDVWKENKLRCLSQVFEANSDACYAFSDGEIIDHAGKDLGIGLWEAFRINDQIDRFQAKCGLELLLKRNLITGAALAFRASLKDAVLPIPPGWMHDYWIGLVGSSFSYGVPVRERLIRYRRHDKQTCFRRPTLTQWYLGMLKESLGTRGEDMSRKAESFRQLQNRVEYVSRSVPCSSLHLELIRAKTTHLERRSELRSRAGLSRVIGVLAEAATGRYQRFSPGWRSIARDL
jgi:hypothetical protein